MTFLKFWTTTWVLLFWCFGTVSAQQANESAMDYKQASTYLKQMRKRYFEELKLPQARKMLRSRELTGKDVEYFVGGIKRYKESAMKDIDKVTAAAIQVRGYDDLVRQLGPKADELIEREIKILKAFLDQLVGNAVRDAESVAKLDPEKNRYSFATASVRERYEDKFERTFRTLKQAEVLEASLGLEDVWSKHRAGFEKNVAEYHKKAAVAGVVKKLPADIGDSTLTKIARDTLLSKEKYGVGEIEKLVVNARKVPRDRIETRVFNGALETIVREWEEFQVVTVEKEGDELFVYFNSLKKFSRGPNTTPIDQWILAKRYKQGRIAPENVK